MKSNSGYIWGVEKDLISDKRTDLLHDFAQELKKNKEELARQSQEKWERPSKRPDLR